MARFVHIEYPVQHEGVARVTRGLEALASFNIVHGFLHGLALLGAPIARAGARARAGMAALAAARRQRIEDDKLWSLALSDARVMADLSRAMSRDAVHESRGYSRGYYF